MVDGLVMEHRKRTTALLVAVTLALSVWLQSGEVLRAAIWFSMLVVLGTVTIAGGARNGVRSAAWRTLGASLFCYGIAELLLTAESQRWYGASTFAPSYAAYAVANFTMLIGFVRLVKSVAPRLDRTDWIDCTLVTIGPGCLLWQFVVAPLAPNASISVLDRSFLVGILVFDFAFALMAWRLMAGRKNLVSGWVLFAMTMLMTVADTIYDLGVLHGSETSGATELLYPMCWTLLAVAGLHPSVRLLTTSVAKATRLPGGRYFATLALVTSAAPGAILAVELFGNGSSVLPLSVATLVVFLLVVYRIRLLVSDLERVGTELTVAATHDGLTGLANRRMLMTQLEKALLRRHSNGDRCVLIYADLNGFKATNDTLGHSVGDELLIEAGKALAAVCRPSDTVARLGGDEFIVLLTDGQEGDSVLALADRIRSALTITRLPNGTQVQVSASVGVAVEPEQGCSAADLLQAADAAMYAEKQSSRLTQREPEMKSSAVATA
jgi:diguanylate cyclase (GGDEF)-like protein